MSMIPQDVPTGAIRYNTDSNKMECFDGTKWWEVAVSSPDLNGGARGVVLGGQETPGGTKNVIQYITISTAGNAVDFGDLTQNTRDNSGAASNTRGLSLGAADNDDTISYITTVSYTHLTLPTIYSV